MNAPYKFTLPVLFLFLAPVFSFAKANCLAFTTHEKDTMLFKNGPGGLIYKIYIDKQGQAIKKGDFVSINFTIKNDRDSLLSSSYDIGHPAMTIIDGPRFVGDIYAGLSLLSEGDSAVFKINIDSTEKNNQTIQNQKGKYFTYNIKVEKVIAKAGLSDDGFKNEIQQYVKSLKNGFKADEPFKIKKYIDDNKLAAVQTASGLNYTIIKQGAGDKAAENDTVVVNYTVKLTNGKVIETNIRAEAEKAKLSANSLRLYQPLRVPVKMRSGMIAGWNEGMLLLNKGAKAILIVPSALAYGESGSDTIPPFSPLIFEVELLDVVHPALKN